MLWWGAVRRWLVVVVVAGLLSCLMGVGVWRGMVFMCRGGRRLIRLGGGVVWGCRMVEKPKTYAAGVVAGLKLARASVVDPPEGVSLVEAIDYFVDVFERKDGCDG